MFPHATRPLSRPSASEILGIVLVPLREAGRRMAVLRMARSDSYAGT